MRQLSSKRGNQLRSLDIFGVFMECQLGIKKRKMPKMRSHNSKKMF